MTDKEIINYLTPKMTPYHLMRIGRFGDGGYIAPLEHVASAKNLISFGVGDDISFEQHIKAINPDISIDLYDGTVANFPGILDCKFHKENIYFDCTNPFSSITNPTICKCDIEGEEYNLSHLPMISFSNIMTLIIEIHDIEKNENRLIHLLTFLSAIGFNVVHIHGNNHRSNVELFGVTIPSTLEITFSKGLMTGFSNAQYPIQGLDCPCCSWLPELSLDFVNNKTQKHQQ